MRPQRKTAFIYHKLIVKAVFVGFYTYFSILFQPKLYQYLRVIAHTCSRK